MSEEARKVDRELLDAFVQALDRLREEQPDEDQERRASFRVPMPTAPTVPRFYETTCVDTPGSGAVIQILSMPWAVDLAIAWQSEDTRYLVSARRTAEDLEIPDLGTRVIEPRDLVPAILATRPDFSRSYEGPLPADFEDYVADYTMTRMPRWASHVEHIDPRLYLFAARVAYEPLIPVEGSPLHATSLAKLAGTAGADAALVLSGAHDPLLLIVAPVAVVVMGAATGVASGLRQGLAEGVRRNVVRWLTGLDPGPNDEPNDEPPPSDSDEPVSS